MKALGKVGLVLAGLLVGLLTAEVGLRAVGAVQGVDYSRFLLELRRADRLPPSIWRAWKPGARDWPRLQPGGTGLALTSEFSVQYAINSRGLREREIGYARTPGKTRVLALGDSFLFGEGVAFGERFSDRLGAALPDIELINTGVPGWGIDLELLEFLREGHRYRPQLVVLFINRMDTGRHLSAIYRGGKLHIPKNIDGLPPASVDDSVFVPKDDPLFAGEIGWFTRTSHVLSYVRYQLARRAVQARMAAGLSDKDKDSFGLSDGGMRQESVASFIERTRAILGRLASECAARGARLLVINIDHQYELGYIAEIPGLTYASVAVALNARGRERNLSFVYDPHYTPATHSFIAEQVEPILRAAVMDVGRTSRGK